MDGLQARLEAAAIVKKPGAAMQVRGAARTRAARSRVRAPPACADARRAGPGQAEGGANVSVSAAQALLRTAQLAIHHWKEVDLDEKRKGWEASTLEVANAQEASAGSRKALAETTKAFKKLDDTEKLAGWGALLKSYQAEVDSLTKRSKAAELAFLNMFKALRDVPSPVPVLTSLAEEVESVIALKTAHDKASKELAEYKEEFQSLKNQDVTIQRLKDKIASMEDERAEQVAAAVEEERKGLEQRFVEKQEKEKSREKELQAQIKELKEQVAVLNRKHDELQSGAMENQAELESTLSARQSQIDLLSEEVDRLTGQVCAPVSCRSDLASAVACALPPAWPASPRAVPPP